jgi:hypothetical protein
MEQPEAAHRNSDLQKEPAEVLRQRVAISAVLRAIANSPHDLQPIFDTIIDSAVHLCRAKRGTFHLSEEIGFHLVAHKTIPAVSELKRVASANTDRSPTLAERQDCRRGSLLDDDELFYVLIRNGEIDSGLHPLMALPETVECRYGKHQDSHCNWRLPRHRSSRGPGLSRSRL